jgi:hypothetical protein
LLQSISKQLLCAKDYLPLGSTLVRRVGSFLFMYFGLYRLGYPDRAWAISREMLKVAQRSSVPYVLAQASCFAAAHHLERGDNTAAQRCAEEAMAARTEKLGLVTLSAIAASCHGAALIAQGRYEEGIAGLRQGSPPSALPEEPRILGIRAF